MTTTPERDLPPPADAAIVARRRAIAESFVRAAIANRRDELFALATDDAHWWISGTTSVSGRYRLAELFDGAAKLLGDRRGPFTGDIVSITAEADRVSIECWGHVELNGGTTYHNETHLLLRFIGERVSEVREYGDTDLLARLTTPLA